MWFALLAMACTVLASMVVLVLIEAFVPVGTVPPPLVWGRGLRARLARARRYWQIVTIGVRNGLGPYLRDVRRRGLDTADGRAQFGRALTRTLNAGGVTFVKLGQVLAMRRDLIPAEIADELAALQDHARPVRWSDVEPVLRAELGAPVDEVFAAFDREPMAAASVGQVHGALLREGAEVVVKVQRPEIRATVERDLDIAGRIAQRLEEGTPWAKALGVWGLPSVSPQRFGKSSTTESKPRTSGPSAGRTLHAAARWCGYPKCTRRCPPSECW